MVALLAHPDGLKNAEGRSSFCEEAVRNPIVLTLYERR